MCALPSRSLPPAPAPSVDNHALCCLMEYHTIKGRPAEEAEKDVPPAAKKMRLDKFVATHTSEDNSAFQTIMDSSHSKHIAKQWWQTQATEQQLLLDSSQSRMAITWPYDPRNTFFNTPDTDFTATSSTLSMAGREGELTSARIIPENTRMDLEAQAAMAAPPSRKRDREEESRPNLVLDPSEDRYVLASERRALDRKKVDLDSVRGLVPAAAPTQEDAPRHEGYQFVLEPSATPYRAPIVTWGSLDATPRPVGEDFTILGTPQRDTIAHGLADQAAARIKKASKSHKQSPAARALADKLTRRSGALGGVDSQLRAAYTPKRSGGATGETPISLKTPQNTGTPLERARAAAAKAPSHTPVLPDTPAHKF